MAELGVRSLMKRRQFMSRTVAACSLFCSGTGSLLALVCRGQEAGVSAEKNKFMRDAGMSYNDVFQLAVGRIYLPTMRAVAAKFGLDELQKAVMDGTRKQVEALAKKLPSRDLPIFAGIFKNPDPFTANTWEMTIVQDSDRVFEMKVSACLWANTFWLPGLRNNPGKGYRRRRGSPWGARSGGRRTSGFPRPGARTTRKKPRFRGRGGRSRARWDRRGSRRRTLSTRKPGARYRPCGRPPPGRW